MQTRGFIYITLALSLGIAALILHLLAMCSPSWKITKRDREPVMTPVSYGLWERCEYTNITIMKQGVALGVRPNVQICRPNHYMRYSVDNFDTCYFVRRNCPVVETSKLPDGCSCHYLPSAKGLQWLTIIASIFLILGLLLLYSQIILSAQNKAAGTIFNLGPFICFFLTLILMSTTLILLGAYLRRDIYEDYSFPLATASNATANFQGFDIYSLRIFAKRYESTFSRDDYIEARDKLLEDFNTHYHTKIGWATGFEIIATLLVLIITIVTFLFGASLRSDDI